MNDDKRKYAPALERFFFGSTRSQEPELADEAEKLPSPLREVAQSFGRNINAALTVASLPFRMTSISVSHRVFQQILAKHRILSLKSPLPGEDPLSDEERQARALEAARAEFAKTQKEEQSDRSDPLGPTSRLVLDDLMSLQENSGLGEACDELLLQCTVLLWGALEVLATDLFVVLLNQRPSRTGQLLEDVRTKRYFDQKAFGAALQERNYDLSQCMGEVLIQQHRIDSVEAIRNIFDVLFPGNQTLRDVLSETTLWMFGQDRNLIVHRRAIIDQEYIENTGHHQPVGTILRILGDPFEEYLTFTVRAGSELIRAAAN